MEAKRLKSIATTIMVVLIAMALSLFLYGSGFSIRGELGTLPRLPEIAVLAVRKARSIRHVPSTAVPLTFQQRFVRGKVPCTGFRFAHFLPVHPEKSTDQRASAAIRRAIGPAESAAVRFLSFSISG